MSLDADAAAPADELAKELARTVADAQAQLQQERELVLREFEAARSHLQREYAHLLAKADSELDELLQERAALHASQARQNDVVSLNVGGQLFTVKRETLCVCRGSFLADLFSGRWDGDLQKDQQGNVFLDLDPMLFEALLGWLRDRKIETPDRLAPPPRVVQEDLAHFQAMLDYLGLRDHLDLPGLGPDGWSSATTSLAAIRKEAQGGSALSMGLDTGAPGLATGSRAAAGERTGILEAAGSLFASIRGYGGSEPGPSNGSTGFGPGSQGVGGASASGSRRPVGWSRRNSHPAAVISAEAGNTVAISDTRGQASAAAARATRGFQQGEHYWEVKVLSVSDYSYVGFVSAEWGHFQTPVGRSPHSWGLASNGNLHDGRHDRGASLPLGYSSGSTVGWLLQLGNEPSQRTASVFVDGRLFENVFSKLPETLYPAVSNMRAPAQYSIFCDVELPPKESWTTSNVSASRQSAEAIVPSYGSDSED